MLSQTGELTSWVSDCGVFGLRVRFSKASSYHSERQFRIAADIHAFVVDAQGTEIFREAFVEPALRGRIVVVHKIVRQRMRDRAPGIGFEQIQDNVDAVARRNDKSLLHILFRRSD